jgi:LUD domain
VNMVLPDPGPPNLEFERPADRDHMERTVVALEGRGFRAVIAEDSDDARRLVFEELPAGAEVHTALSETLRKLGVTAEIDESGRYDSVRAKLATYDRETQGREMAKLGAAPDHIVGSAHAITDDGVILVGSGSGSQLGPYAYSAGAVTLVVGHQKLVRDHDEGMRRIHEYCLPREFARMQAVGYPGSLLAKMLTIYAQPGGRIRVILVPETLRF